MSSTSQEDLSSQGDAKGVDESGKTGQQQRFEDSPTPPQSMILPGYYSAQQYSRQTAYASPEVNYYYHHQQQNFGGSATADSSAGESTRDSPVQLGRAFVSRQQHQQSYGGASGRTYDASSGAVPSGSSIPDSAAPRRRSGDPEGNLGIGGAAGAAAAAASLLYQTSYPGGKVNYNPNYPTMGGPPSPTGYPEGVPRRYVLLTMNYDCQSVLYLCVEYLSDFYFFLNKYSVDFLHISKPFTNKPIICHSYMVCQMRILRLLQHRDHWDT